MKRRKLVFMAILGVVAMMLANCGGAAVTPALTTTHPELVLSTSRAVGGGVTATPTPTTTLHDPVLPTPGAGGSGLTVTPAPTATQPNDSGVVSASFNITTSGSSTLVWTHWSSKNGDLPAPSNATQQTASLILDVDKDGVSDLVIGSRRDSPATVWYQRNANGWTRYLIDDATLDIEAGGAFWDIDGDGDLDVVMGGDSSSNKVWWWENPYPNYDPDTPWTRREIKNSGSNKHHDQIWGRL